MSVEQVRTVGLVVAGILGISLPLFLLLLATSYRRLKELDIPPGATLGETLRAVPFSLVLAIDLLDLALDILAAPVVWALLDHFHLTALRNVSAVEALVPFTGPIPTLSIAWLLVRLG